MISKRVQAIIGKQFIWVHNPKTGGTSLAEACIKYGVGKRLMLDFDKRPERSIGDHLTFAEIKALKPDIPEMSIAFVRHPVDWIQSFWNFHTKKGSIRGFKAFKEILWRTPSQREYVEGVRHVLRYESLDITQILYELADLEGVRSLMNPISMVVERQNTSDTSITPLTLDQLEEIGHYWKPDAEFFDYA